MKKMILAVCLLACGFAKADFRDEGLLFDLPVGTIIVLNTRVEIMPRMYGAEIGGMFNPTCLLMLKQRAGANGLIIEPPITIVTGHVKFRHQYLGHGLQSADYKITVISSNKRLVESIECSELSEGLSFTVGAFKESLQDRAFAEIRMPPADRE